MHRSGTTMITGLLEKLGLFAGHKIGVHKEALFFLHLNDWMLRQSGGAWDYPLPMLKLLESQSNRELVLDYLRFSIKTPRSISFLGVRDYMRYRDISKLNRPWGWKDPRNTFTLPLWLDLFPEAKVIHIYRHGVDVAQSLKVRQEVKDNTIMHSQYRLRKPIYLIVGRRQRFSNSLRCATLGGGFSLWEEYMQEACRHMENLGSQGLEVRYEDFLKEPKNNLATILNFCDLNVSDDEIATAVQMVEANRALAFRKDDRLNAFAQEVEKNLRPYGYSAVEQSEFLRS